MDRQTRENAVEDTFSRLRLSPDVSPTDTGRLSEGLLALGYANGIKRYSLRET